MVIGAKLLAEGAIRCRRGQAVAGLGADRQEGDWEGISKKTPRDVTVDVMSNISAAVCLRCVVSG
jgi:hypothetical protein